MSYKKVLVILFSMAILSVPAYAVRITGDEIPFQAMFHIGAVDGLGLGVNFGIDAGIPIGDFEIAAELEQSVTDYEFDVNLNPTKIGILLRYTILPDSLWVAFHVGSVRFTASKATTFVAMGTGKEISVDAEVETRGSYSSISLDYKWGEVMITPRGYLNFLPGGAVPEMDLNLGVRF